ncbi:MarR family transcriptional regulator [Paenibacillus polygoni]|uniref:MarR family transcriptional regulator n=1 Tax=Paenibacillus polygoni TaxID=3050112 RepID=A0ABY8X426_9BACL|nr:MarR family transcriptional regulator [Paenibacillus polygoni]WIV20287.1 MarR family transcriptional regulator [Paenibacillus polygoni]
MKMDEKQFENYVDTFVQRTQSISINMQSIQKEFFKASSITPDQFNLMNVINTTEHCTSSFLAKALNVKKSSITAIVNRLTDKGLIKREFNEKDKREVFLELTEEGQNKLSEEKEKILEILKPLRNNLTVEEIEKLNLYLSMIDTQLNLVKKDIIKHEI